MEKIKLVCNQCALIIEVPNVLIPEPRCQECGCSGFLREYAEEEADKINRRRSMILSERKKAELIPEKPETMKKVEGAWTRKVSIERRVFEKDILQPVDRKTGYMNENFNKVYGEKANPFVGTDRDKRTQGKGLKTV